MQQIQFNYMDLETIVPDLCKEKFFTQGPLESPLSRPTLSIEEILEDQLTAWVGAQPVIPREPSLKEHFERQMIEFQNKTIAKCDIQECHQKQTVSLQLNQLNLSDLPGCMQYLTHLKKLSLEDNLLSSIPDSWENLEELEELYLTSNQLTHLPDWLATLPRLRILEISSNRIEQIPDALLQKQNLSITHHRSFLRVYHWTMRESGGYVNLKEAANICFSLNQHNRQISFKTTEIVGQLKGGTCSAMALSLLNKYCALVASEEGKDLHPTEIFEKLEPEFMKSSQDYRTLQAAYNTFQFIQSNENQRRRIIEALSNHFSIQIINEYPGFDFEEDPKTHLTIITKLLQETPKKGALVIRAIIPADTPKKETCGHTMILFRTGETGDYLYEPGGGIYQLERGQEDSGMYQLLTFQYRKWKVSSFRFYLADLEW